MLFSCGTNRLDTGFWTLEYQDPNIQDFDIECENEQWKVDIRTEHWTGNGLLWIADENRYERHTVYLCRQIQKEKRPSAHSLPIGRPARRTVW